MSALSNSYNIRAMKDSMDASRARMEAALLASYPSKNDPDVNDMIFLMNQYRELFGSEGLRALYAKCGNDWRETVRAIRELVVGESTSCNQDNR